MQQLYKMTSGGIQKSGIDLKNRIVPGYYTSATLDLQGHMIDKNAMLEALDDYRTWGTIREMHENAVGVADKIGIPEWNWIAAKISNSASGTNVLQLVQDKVYKAFSVGILVTKGEFTRFDNLNEEDLAGVPMSLVNMFREYGEIFRITGLALVEVSIVDRPANPQARVQDSQKSSGVQADVLPSIFQPKALDTLSGIVHSSVDVVVTKEMYDAIHADNTKELPVDDSGNGVKQDTNIASNESDVLNSQSEVTVSDEKNVEVAAEEIEVVAEDKVAEPVAEEEVAVEEKAIEADEVIDEQPADEQLEDVVAEAEVEAEGENVDKAIELAKAIEAISKRLDDLDARLVEALQPKVEDDKPVDEAEEPVVEPEVEEKSADDGAKETVVVLNDEQLKGVVSAIVAELAAARSERKAAVHNEKVDEEPKQADVSTMPTDELSKLLALTAARRM